MIGAHRRWCKFEFAKSRGGIHFRIFAICADRQPRRRLYEMEGEESIDIADALAMWARAPSRSPRFAMEIRLGAA